MSINTKRICTIKKDLPFHIIKTITGSLKQRWKRTQGSCLVLVHVVTMRNHTWGEKVSGPLWGARSNRTCVVSKVHLLPHHRPADAEEVPQVAEDSTVERALLAVTVLEVGDPVTWHELPSGTADGHQVEVAAQQQHNHHRENTNHDQTRQKETVAPEPQIPGVTGWDSRPAKQMSVSLIIQEKHLNIEMYRADIQSDVKSPQQSEKLYQQVDDKPAVVPLTNTVLYPRTMVVEAPDAVFTRLTVLCSHWLLLGRNIYIYMHILNVQ